MSTTTRVADKAGVVGAIVGSFSCAMCFPAAASIGAAIGLGFLSHWEGLFVHMLIPIFALIALFANLVGWSSHRQWHRALLGAVGPIVVLIGAFGLTGVFGLTHGFLPRETARGTFYAGMIIMIVMAVWDLISPANRRCVPRAGKHQSAELKTNNLGRKASNCPLDGRWNLPYSGNLDTSAGLFHGLAS